MQILLKSENSINCFSLNKSSNKDSICSTEKEDK